MNIQEQKIARKLIFDILQETEAKDHFVLAGTEDCIMVTVHPSYTHIANTALQDKGIQYRIVSEEVNPNTLNSFAPVDAGKSNSSLLPLRQQAIEHARAAARLLEQAGCKEDMLDIFWKEQEAARAVNNLEEDEFGAEYFNCAVCGDDHNMNLVVKKPQISYQYWISFEYVTYYHTWSFWEKLKAWGRSFKYLFIEKKEVNDFYISHQDTAKLKDVVNRIPLP